MDAMNIDVTTAGAGSSGGAFAVYPPQHHQQHQQQGQGYSYPPSMLQPPQAPQGHPQQAFATSAEPVAAQPTPAATENASAAGYPLAPAFRPKVQQLKAMLLQRQHWRVCRGQPTAAHRVPPTEFDAPGDTVCRNCKQSDPKYFVEPEEADAKIKELLGHEPCHFVPRYDQAGCGVDKDRPDFDGKRWQAWVLKPGSRGTVLRERLWQCCLGGGKKAAARYRAGQTKNTNKIGCPRSLYAVTRWDAVERKAKCVEIYFKHRHLPECFDYSNLHTGGTGAAAE
ncbi:hypothetical protein H9P43_009940 [Blastocladiella emersonii ATCC 22665]|nr:hypothetical protein H9P43_009940 [Blastocladiella emersonii ATCC 22665]